MAAEEDQRRVVDERVTALANRLDTLLDSRRRRVAAGRRRGRARRSHGADLDVTLERIAAELEGLSSRLDGLERAEKERHGRAGEGGRLSSLREVVRQARRLSRPEEIDDFGLDRSFVDTLRPIIETLYDRYFRVDAEGADTNVPAEGPAILVANRGGPVAYDALMIAEAVRRADPSRRIRFQVDRHMGSALVIGPLLARLGGVREAGDNAARLVEEGQPFLFFPEGFRGAVKTGRDRYRLAEFSLEFAETAARLGLPVVPVAVVGSEEAQPVIGRLPLLARALGWPAFPLAPLGIFPLPVKFRIRFCSPIAPPGSGAGSLAARARTLRKRTREAIQLSLGDLLSSRDSVFLG